MKYTCVNSLDFGSPDNHLASHLMFICDYVWYAFVCNSVNLFLRLIDVSDVESNKYN